MPLFIVISLSNKSRVTQSLREWQCVAASWYRPPGQFRREIAVQYFSHRLSDM
jgi:hypothetical protein